MKTRDLYDGTNVLLQNRLPFNPMCWGADLQRPPKMYDVSLKDENASVLISPTYSPERHTKWSVRAVHSLLP